MFELRIKIFMISLVVFYMTSFNKNYSQSDLHSIGVDFGTIHSVDPYSDSIVDDLLLFPEVFVGGDFITSNFNWKVSLGYWNDGVNEPRYSDVSNFSYSSFVCNAELIYLTPDSNPKHSAPLRVLTGLSYHYIAGEDMGLYESETIPKNNFTDNLFYFNTGLELHIFLKSYFSLFTKGILFLQLNKNKEDIYTSPRFQLSLGLNFRFNS